MYNYIRYCSPLGMLTVTAEGGTLTALVIDEQKYADRHLAGEGKERETPVLHAARLWLDAYFAGEAPEVSGLPLSPKGTAFQKKVWQELLKIPYGVTMIGDYAFYEANIKTLLIPSSVTSVGSYAFCYMSYLEHLYYNKPTPTSGLSFTGLKSGCVLSVPYQSRSNYSSNSTWSSAFTGGIDGKAYDLSKLDDVTIEFSNVTIYQMQVM